MQQLIARACIAGTLILLGCGGGGGKGDSIITFQLTTAEAVSGLSSVRLTAGSVAKTYALTGLSPTATSFNVTVPSTVTGQIDVGAIARPAVGCMGFGGANVTNIAAAGDHVTVAIQMQPLDTCQSGTAGTSGTAGAAGTTGAAGASGAAGRGGTTGAGGAAGQPSCNVAAGGQPAPVAPPSLTRCTEYSHNDPGAVCSTTTNANNAYINDVAVSPDGQYLATAGSHFLTSPTAIDALNDRVKIWRLQGGTPTQCGSINITQPGLGAPYVAFSPNGQYLAVAWRRDYVYVYSVPAFTLVSTIGSSYGPLYGVGWTPDSQAVISVDYDSTTSDGTLYADLPNGTAITQRALGGVDPDVLAVSPVAGAGNVTTLVVGGFDGNAGLYTFDGSMFSAPTIIPTAPLAETWSARFSPSGNLLALGTDEGIVRFWNIPLASTTPTGSPIVNTTGGTIFAIAFSPQGTHVALGFDFEADIWNVSTRAFVSRATAVTYVDSLTFSASGGALIAGEANCARVLICAD